MVALYGYYGYGYYYDPMYILIIISCVIALIAQVKVKSTFNKYSRVSSSKGMTGAMVAEQLLRSQGIYDVSIQRVIQEIRHLTCQILFIIQHLLLLSELQPMKQDMQYSMLTDMVL